MLLPGDRWRRRNRFSIPRVGQTIRSRRSLFVRLVSHSPTLCHLAGTSDSESTSLDVPLNFCGNVGRAQRVGNFFGKDNELTGGQALPGKETDARLNSSQDRQLIGLELSRDRVSITV